MLDGKVYDAIISTSSTHLCKATKEFNINEILQKEVNKNNLQFVYVTCMDTVFWVLFACILQTEHTKMTNAQC